MVQICTWSSVFTKQTWFELANNRLCAVVHEPRRVCKTAVVFAHTLGSHKAENSRLLMEIANLAAGAGFLSVNFDFRGCGDSDLELSEITRESLEEDMRKVVTEVERMGTSLKIGVGYGFGSEVAIEIADVLDGLVLISPDIIEREPAISLLKDLDRDLIYREGQIDLTCWRCAGAPLYEWAESQSGGEELLRGLAIPPEMICGQKIGLPFVLEWTPSNIVEKLRNLSLPCLIICGELDPDMTTKEISEEKQEPPSSEKIDFLKISHANKMFTHPDWRSEVSHGVQRFLNWFGDHY